MSDELKSRYQLELLLYQGSLRPGGAAGLSCLIYRSFCGAFKCPYAITPASQSELMTERKKERDRDREGEEMKREKRKSQGLF